jgi:hypothetical protein
MFVIKSQNREAKMRNSWVQFESRLTAKAGKNIQSLFILPVLWFFFPALAGEKEELSEGPYDEEG